MEAQELDPVAFPKGVFFGMVLCLLLIFFILPEAVIYNATKIFTYNEQISCQKLDRKREVDCMINFDETKEVEAVFCRKTEKGLQCTVKVSDDFVTPGYLKELYY